MMRLWTLLNPDSNHSCSQIAGPCEVILGRRLGLRICLGSSDRRNENVIVFSTLGILLTLVYLYFVQRDDSGG